MTTCPTRIWPDPRRRPASPSTARTRPAVLCRRRATAHARPRSGAAFRRPPSR
ncbi:hypothetical protein Rumeso_00158 [Rubellimicrobium mesophilum DSM 19309]|uniref:Uncharacterized protein n=1 Tax=Rubellimicrobium mesophilum DSM 19309 TaxID=442562 RepID=A0A017HX39_9RHOB|nr:hypothetical protein Rumeso_00158 [Rubellimicrobium mesophilum DSM 19309]